MLQKTRNIKAIARSLRHRSKVRILMIDDHPSQIEGYKVILSYNESNFDIEAVSCYTCEEAYRVINTSKQLFDIVFLDERMPSYSDKNIRSGADLVKVINQNLPDSKIVIITSHCEAFLLYNIAKKVSPAGILVKSDFRPEELLSAFDQIMAGKTYYSQTVSRCIKELLSKEAYLDSFNRQIITLLAQGVRTKNLPDYLHLSLSAIEKRKAQVKDYFCLERGSDEDIVREAKRLGFI